VTCNVVCKQEKVTIMICDLEPPRFDYTIECKGRDEDGGCVAARIWGAAGVTARGGGRFGLGRRKVWRDIIIFAIDTGTWDSYIAARGGSNPRLRLRACQATWVACWSCFCCICIVTDTPMPTPTPGQSFSLIESETGKDNGIPSHFQLQLQLQMFIAPL